jgi:Leucine-rich repeat (LRR) protein
VRFQFGFKTLAVFAVLVALLATGYRRHLAYQALDIVQSKAKFVRPVPKTKGWIRIFDGDIWRIHHLSFHGSPGITDDEVRQVRHLTSLRRLSLHHAAISDASAPVLARLMNLQALSLQRTQITDRTIVQLAHLKQLESLSLRDTTITDEALAVIGRLPKLRELLLDRTDITPAGLVHLQELTQLERLTIRQNRSRRVSVEQKADRAGIRSLAYHTRLKELDISSWEVLESDLEFLGYLPQLEWLSIWSNATSFPFEFWQQLPRLERIWIRNKVPCDVHCENHASLRQLSIFPRPNDESSVEFPSLILRNLPNLNSWSDSGRRWSRIEYSKLPQLSDISAQGESIMLRDLDAESIHLYGFRSLSLSELPNVVMCRVSPRIANRDTIEIVSQLPKLATLFIQPQNEQPTDASSGAELFSPLRNTSTLKSLHLADFTLAEEDMRAIAEANLQILNISSCQLSESAARVLLDMPSLKYVQLPVRLSDDIKDQLLERGLQTAPPSGLFLHNGNSVWYDPDFAAGTFSSSMIIE